MTYEEAIRKLNEREPGKYHVACRDSHRVPCLYKTADGTVIEGRSPFRPFVATSQEMSSTLWHTWPNPEADEG